LIFPTKIVECFAAVAGAMELLDKQFLRLRERRQTLVNQYCESYAHSRGLSYRLDVARLIAFFKCRFPLGAQFPAGTEKICLAALRQVGVGNARQLSDLVDGQAFTREVRKYSSHHSIEPAYVSYLLLVILVVVLTTQSVAVDLFPAMFSDPGLDAILKSLSRRKRR
jgi:hypothetical protein